MQFLGYINIYVNISMNIYIYISIPQLLGGVSHVDRNHGQMLYIYLRIYHQKSTIHVGIYIYIHHTFKSYRMVYPNFQLSPSKQKIEHFHKHSQDVLQNF